MAGKNPNEGRFEVAVDQWGSHLNHHYVKGTVLENLPEDFPGDVKWAVENGILIDLDAQAEAVAAERARDIEERQLADPGSGPSPAPRVTRAPEKKD